MSAASSSSGSVAAGGANQIQNQNGNVNGFLIKLWKLLENSCDNSIVWSDDGRSFIISDPHAFSNSLSKYFKHSKLSSFIRQLNMYGFRKVTSNLNWKAGSDIKVEDDLHFYHPNFRRGEQSQLALIRRKMPTKFPNTNTTHNSPSSISFPLATNGAYHQFQHQRLTSNGTMEPHSNGNHVNAHTSAFDLNELRSALNEVRVLDIRQTETSNSIVELKHENETLWTELLDLRSKYNEQRDIVTTLIKFIVESIQSRLPVSKNRKFSNLMIGNLENSGQLASDIINYNSSSMLNTLANDINNRNNQANTNNIKSHQNKIVNSHQNNIINSHQDNNNIINNNCDNNSIINNNCTNTNASQIHSDGVPSAVIFPSSVSPSCSTTDTSQSSTNELSTWLNDQLVSDASEACQGLENFMELFGGEIPLEEDEDEQCISMEGRPVKPEGIQCIVDSNDSTSSPM